MHDCVSYSVRLLALLAHLRLSLTSNGSSCSLHPVDGIAGCAVDHCDIGRDGWAKELLVQLHGTLGLGQEEEEEECELDGVVEWHPEQNILQESLNEAEARVNHPVGEPQAVFVGAKEAQVELILASQNDIL